MPRAVRTLASSFFALTCASAHCIGEARAGEFWERQERYPRVKAAAEARIDAVERAFVESGAAWPPRQIFLRGFKSEGVLELWAAPRDASAHHVLVRSFPVCAKSGSLGPKRRQGDLQVPEGFYKVRLFNPRSAYHLSLGVSYPNAADLFHSRGQPPGDAIMIHGNCVTIGCIPLQDGPIEDLYLAAAKARDAGQQEIAVHLFPCRLDDAACQARLAEAAEERPDLAAFWADLAPGYLEFVGTGKPPVVRARKDGTYELVRAGGT